MLQIYIIFRGIFDCSFCCVKVADVGCYGNVKVACEVDLICT